MADVRKNPIRDLPKPYPHATFPLPDAKETAEKELSDRSQVKVPLRPGDAEPKGGTSPEEQQWAELVEALRLNRRRLLRIPGVTAVDIGYKISNGFFTDELALRVHVERKFPDDSLDTVFKDRPYDFIYKRYPASFPEERKYRNLRGIPVPMDVIEADYKPVQLSGPPRPGMVMETPLESDKINRRRRLDPLVGGISIGSPQVPVGTLGALVWDKKDGSVCILSNWHVLSGDLQAEVGTPCFQPGRFDQGRSSDVVARLKRWCFDSKTDAAIAELTGSRHYCAGEIIDMFQQISGVTNPYLGMKVLKSGRTTGLTGGFVDGLFFSSALEYSNGVVQVFEEQIHIAPQDPNVRISEAGDSGSVWVTETNGKGYAAVGLHFAGDLPRSAFGEYALANPMTVVIDRLGFSFRPVFLEVRDDDVIQTASPAAGQLMQPHLGNGIQPVRILIDGLRGSGGQPDPILVEPTG